MLKHKSLSLSVKKNKSTSSRDMHSLPDEEILTLFKKTADNELIGILYQRYSHLVIGVCMKYLKDEEKARDGAMQLFIDLFEKLKKHEIEHFKSWLYTATKNHCLMMLRKDGRDRKLFNELEIREKKFVENDVDLHLNKEQLEKKLHDFMKRLKEEQRVCLQLMYFEDKSYKEIAEMTGYDLKKVKSYIQNGKRNLKLSFDSDEG